MNSKMIIIAVLVLVVAAVYLYTANTRPSQGPSTTGTPNVPPTSVSTSDVTTQATEASIILGNEYSSLMQEELDKLSTEQSDFNSQTQDSIANDLSQFYYT